MSYTTLTYNPFNTYNALGPHNQSGFPTMLQYNYANYNHVGLPAYPNTLVQNNVLDTSWLEQLRFDESKLTFIDDFPEPTSNIDNTQHEINTGTNFNFHRSDVGIGSEGSFPQGFSLRPLFYNFGNTLFTDPYNFHFTLPNGRTGYNDYSVVFPHVDVPEGPPLIDPDLSNPLRFHGTYGLDQDGKLINPNAKSHFDASEYDDHTGTDYGEFMHWMEVFALDSVFKPTPQYTPSFGGIVPPKVNIFDQAWSGLSQSNAWDIYIDKHVIGNHSGSHNVLDVVNSVFDIPYTRH